MIKISVIIPVYNVSKWIKRCLLSVLNQTYAKMECIIVDDASPDDSVLIIRDLLKNYTGPAEIKLLHHQINKGLSEARNTGVKESTGDYLLFLDSDDELYSNTTIELYSSYVESYGQVDFLLGNYDIIGHYLYTPLQSDVFTAGNDILLSFLKRKWYVMACAKLLNRSFFLQNNLWFKSGLLHEDILFSFRLAIVANTMITVKEKVYKYYIQENSITQTMRYQNYADFLYIMEQCLKTLNTMNIPSNLIAEYFVPSLFGFLHSAVSNPDISKKEKDELITRYGMLSNTYIQIGSCKGKHRIEYIILNLRPLSVKAIIRVMNFFRKGS